MTVTAIRVDADPSKGLGHLERSLSLAAELARLGHRPVFVTRDRTVLGPRVAQAGFTDVVTFADEAAEVEAILSRRPGLVVFDAGSTTHQRIAPIKEVGCFVVTFEDLGAGRYLADIVIDANLTESTNPRKMVTTTRYFLGPEYAIISPACQAAKKRNRKYTTMKKVIMTCGGSDPAGVTPRSIKALSFFDANVDVDVIIGPAFVHVDELNEALLQTARSFSIVESPRDLPARMRAADVGIISGGVTLFEAAYLGLPSIVIAQNSAQLKNLPPFESHGGIISLGLSVHNPFPNLLSTLRTLSDPGKLRAMSESQEKYIDGKGLDRIMTAIKQLLGT